MKPWGWLPRPWREALIRHGGHDLVILDDFFPNLLTGFRVAEYNALLQAMPGLQIFSTLPDFHAHHAAYAQRHPLHAHRVYAWDGTLPPQARRAYLNFLNNAHAFLPTLEDRCMALWVTLYPGGGFGLNEPESDEKLLRLLRSPVLQGLTVTQPITRDYIHTIARTHGLRLPPVHLLPGVVVSPEYFQTPPRERIACGPGGKATVDIAFVAERYMPGGLNKGYPAFIEAACALASDTRIRWHVVGSFGPADHPSSPQSITWHGRLHTTELRHFLHGIDIVISPNRPFLLHPGNFDGFPTGACVEASLCGALLIVSDELRQNPGYVPGQDIVLIEPTAQAVQQALQPLLDNPAQITAMAQAGQVRTRALYHPQQQILPRERLLKQWKAKPPGHA